MKLILTSVVLLFFTFDKPIFAQKQEEPKYELRGAIRDVNSPLVVVPGLRLRVKQEGKEISDFTDINGEFRFLLSAGEFVLTSDALVPEKFRVFLKITKNGVNPDFLEFGVDTNAIGCTGNQGKQSPGVIRSIEPIYPAAARAVRSGGETSVIVKISRDGKVLSANAITGHPLLKRASEIAAEKFIFESTESTAEREVTITFVFLPDQDVKNGLKRYECQYRIVIYSKPVII